MYRNRGYVFYFCFVCEITRESEKCNLMEACTNSASGDRNFLIMSITSHVPCTIKWSQMSASLGVPRNIKPFRLFAMNDISHRLYMAFTTH